MHSFHWKRVSLWLLAILLVSFAFWLALPRILGLAAERWLAIPGVESLRVGIDEIGAGQARLREVSAVYRRADGLRVSASMHGITLGYSFTERRIQNLDIVRADVEIAPPARTEASPWPRLTWPDLPMDNVNIGDLHVAVHRPDASPLQAQGHLQIRQTGEQLSAKFSTEAGLALLAAGPAEGAGGRLEFRGEWRPLNGPPSNVALRIGREPARQPATLSGKIALAAVTRFTKSLGLDLPVEFSGGLLAWRAEATLGDTTGDLRELSGEAELTDAHGSSTRESMPVEFSSAGKLRFSRQASSVRLELQPGWLWRIRRIDAGGKQPLSATGRLTKVFGLIQTDGEVLGNGAFPFVLRTTPWGNWEGALEQLRLTRDTAGWNAADVRLRLKGAVKQWQQDALQISNARAAGNIVLHWSPPGTIHAGIAVQVTADRIVGKGKVAASAGPATWKVNADATARAGDDFWKTLELKGNASSPQLKIDFGAGNMLTLGPSRLQVLRLRPAGRKGVPNAENAEGELQFFTEALRLRTWNVPGLQARLQFAGGALRGDGSVHSKDKEILRFNATHALSKGCGEATLSTHQSLATLDKLLQPRPPHLQALVLGAGDLDGHAAVTWCSQPAATIEAKGTLQLHEATLGWDKARVQGVQGTLQLDGLNPPQGRLGVTAHAGELATGTSLTDMKVDLALGESSLTVQALHAGLLGGTVHGGPLALDWPPTGQPLPLEIKGIDLGQLLALPDVRGLSGSGTLDGVLPLVYQAGRLEIPEGRLTSPGAGTINYAPSAALPDNPGLQALRNFHYRDLDVTLRYAADGAYRLHNTLEGNNPDFYNGYPIRFKLDINGVLPGLFRAALFSGDFDRHILEQLRSGTLE